MGLIDKSKLQDINQYVSDLNTMMLNIIYRNSYSIYRTTNRANTEELSRKNDKYMI